MKCVVHLDLELMPREFDTPEDAIEYVEQHMKDATMSIRWRRDDLYPDNYSEYTREQLLEEIKTKGEVTLQLVGVSGDDIIIGDIANIITAEREKQDVAEAQAELEKIGKELANSYETEISIRASGETRTFKPDKKGGKRHLTRKRKKK